MASTPNRPVKSLRYTIRVIRQDNKGAAFLLEEIVNPPSHWLEGYEEPGFYAVRFRPIHKTDISVFTAMLNPKKVEEKV